MKCRFEHDEDCCNIGSPQYMCKCKHDICHSAVPMSRGDVIRSMDNLQMSKRLINMIADLCEDGVPSEEYALHWFEMPAEEA